MTVRTLAECDQCHKKEQCPERFDEFDEQQLPAEWLEIEQHGPERYRRQLIWVCSWACAAELAKEKMG